MMVRVSRRERSTANIIQNLSKFHILQFIDKGLQLWHQLGIGTHTVYMTMRKITKYRSAISKLLRDVSTYWKLKFEIFAFSCFKKRQG